MRYLRWCSAVLIVCFVSSVDSAEPDLELPFIAGDIWWCSQGWDGSYSHTGEAAWDYNRSGDLGYPLIAPAAGRIEFAGNSASGYGNVVLINYGDGYYGRLAHLSDLVAEQGEYVKKGQVVGFCGATGGDYSPHIHYNTQTTSSPSGRDYTEAYVDFMDYLGNIIEDGYPEPCDCWSNPPADKYYTSLNSNLLDLAYNHYGPDFIGNPEYRMWDLQAATAVNPNHPWYYAWDHNNRYRTEGIPNNCVIQHLEGGQYWDGAIVYDGLGGARRAYVLHSGFWRDGDNSNGWDNLGGPLSDLGMPITDEYSIGENQARQDFQLGYLLYEQGASPEITVNSYVGTYAPGWTDHGWDPQYSYLFAQVYEDHGARSQVGAATGTIQHVSAVFEQSFEGGALGPCKIIYDPTDETENRVRLELESFVAFFDDFDDGDADGWISVGAGGWSVMDGKYVLQNDGSGLSMSLAGSPEWTDYTLEFDLKASDLTDINIWTRVPGTGSTFSSNLYSIVFVGSRAVLIKYEGNERWRKSYPCTISTGIWYHVAITMEGDRILLVKGGVKVCQRAVEKCTTRTQS